MDWLTTREEELAKRLDWLIRLRWLTVASILLITFIVDNLFRIRLATLPIYSTALIISLYNILFLHLTRRVKSEEVVSIKLPRHATLLIAVQSSVDLLFLTLLLHFTGGVENPFMFYFIFHIIIASILLPEGMGYVQSGLATLFFGILLLLEYLAIIPHYPLMGFVDYPLYKNPLYNLGIFFVFTSTVFVSAFIATSISGKLREREMALIDMGKELLEKDRLKDRYMMMVAHSIKSPLSTVSSLLNLILEGYTDTARTKEVIGRVVRKVDFLHRYTKDLLNLSRIRSGSIRPTPFSFPELVDEILELVVVKERGKGIEVIRVMEEDLPSIEADREEMANALMNLIENAFEYTPSGGKVEVKARGRGEELVFEVSDTGIGIPPDDLPHIFDEFFRASNTKGFSGTGLGLTMVKYIIERHKGRIGVQSELGRGTTFTITVPFRQ